MDEIEDRKRYMAEFREMEEEGMFENLPKVSAIRKMKAIFCTAINLRIFLRALSYT